MKNLLLLLLLSFSIFANAQVGINTDTPEQTLDVNGKIKVGNDTEPPSEGTVRFNETESDFEGYDGAKWMSFTNGHPNFNLSSGDVIPTVSHQTILSGSYSNYISIRTKSQYSSHGILGFTTPPIGKALLIYSVQITNQGGGTNQPIIRLGKSSTLNGTLDVGNFYFYENITGGYTKTFSYNHPIIILEHREYLNMSTFQSNVSLNAYGYLVNVD